MVSREKVTFCFLHSKNTSNNVGQLRRGNGSCLRQQREFLAFPLIKQDGTSYETRYERIAKIILTN